MRIITPCLGSMMIARAVLGPEILVKALFACKFLFDPHFKIREQVLLSLSPPLSFYCHCHHHYHNILIITPPSAITAFITISDWGLFPKREIQILRLHHRLHSVPRRSRLNCYVSTRLVMACGTSVSGVRRHIRIVHGVCSQSTN